MSPFIHAQNISKSFGSDPLFVDLNLGFSAGDRVGIIGPNGSGKSSLLKIFAGLESPDDGELTSKKNLRIAYIPQIQTFDPGKTVFECLMETAETTHVPAFERDALVNMTLGRTGFTNPDQLTSHLSGGWKKRLTLACGLVQSADLILMDEPTNHLDIEGILWLQDLLSTADFAWVLVSHDRYFLDQTVQKTMELNPIFPDGYFMTRGSYSQFLVKRQEFLEAQFRQLEVLRGKVKKETEWLSRSPKARTTKAQFRVDTANRMIQELNELKAITKDTSTRISFSDSGRVTKKLLEAKSISKIYGDRPIIKDCSLLLSPGKRIGVLGLNGSGKTTLLKLLADVEAPDNGSITRAPDLRTVYFDQERAQLDPQWSVARALSETGDQVIFQGKSYHVVSWAKRFGINQDQLPLPVAELSGGERAKLLIARLMLQQADILILDEPTNDLDIPTIFQLEESIKSFKGVLVLVTHDRFMMSRICTSFVGLDGAGSVTSYTAYEKWESSLNQTERNLNSSQDKPKQSDQKKVTSTQKRLSYLEQREFDGMETTILEAETHLETLRNDLENPEIASDGKRLEEAFTALKEAEAETARLYERWAELEGKIAPS